MGAKATLDGQLMFPSEYVAAVEMQGKDANLTIKAVEVAELRLASGGMQRKPILHFEETNKKLVLNKTNSGTLAELLGTEARKWVGHRITLYPSRCDAFGKQADCIRVRPTLPKPKSDKKEA